MPNCWALGTGKASCCSARCGARPRDKPPGRQGLFVQQAGKRQMSTIKALGIGWPPRQAGVALTPISSGPHQSGSVFGVRALYTALAELVVVAHFTYLAVMVFGGLAPSPL